MAQLITSLNQLILRRGLMVALSAPNMISSPIDDPYQRSSGAVDHESNQLILRLNQTRIKAMTAI